MSEVLAFFMWFMPQRLRLAIARRFGEPFTHEGSDAIIWIVGKRTAFLGRGKFVISR
jgi:hypothetical protein